MRHAQLTSLLGISTFFGLGIALPGPPPLPGRLRILFLTSVGTLCMAGWEYAQDEFRLRQGRIAGRKLFGLDLPQPIHLGVDALLCAGSLANLLVLALFVIVTAFGGAFLVAFGVGAASAVVFVRWFLRAHLTNLRQSHKAQTEAELIRMKEQSQAAFQAHLAATEATLARLLEAIGEDAYQKLEKAYLAEHRINIARKLVATQEPLGLPLEQSQACHELIRLVMREASNVLHSAPIIQVFEKFAQIPSMIYWETCDAYADDNRY